MTPRNPFTALLLSIILPGAYVVYWVAVTGNELRSKGADVPPWWYLLIPILGVLHLWRVCKGIEQVTGSTRAGSLLLLMIVLTPVGVFMAQKSLNGRALQAAAAL